MTDTEDPAASLTAIGEHLEAELFRCPRCEGSQFTLTADAMTCSCGFAAPLTGGVPDFFNSYEPASSTEAAMPVDEAFVDELVATLGLGDGASTRRRLAAAIRRTGLQTASEALTAEIGDLRGRFVPAELDHPATPGDANTDPVAVMVRHYLPDRLVLGSHTTANVRLRNDGTTWWSSRASEPLVLAARFVGRFRTTVPEFTQLPVDVVPGRAITLPARIRAPRVPGRYRLEVGLFHGGELLSTGRATSRVRVGPIASKHRFADRVERRAEQLDYAADHVAAVRLVDAALDRIEPAQQRRIVEIGGGVHPQSSSHERSTLVNIDISSPLLELAKLVDEHHGRSIVQLCADALDPPLARRRFDAVTMYATLHHFAEPEQLLAGLSQLVRPGGCIAVMCEPVSDTLGHPETVVDLLKGINEQAFTVEEYLWMFDAAGLEPEEIRVDAGSLKAILRVD